MESIYIEKLHYHFGMKMLKDFTDYGIDVDINNEEFNQSDFFLFSDCFISRTTRDLTM